MKITTVFAAEIWTGSAWRTVAGGLTEEEATAEARSIVREGNRASVAEYSTEEGTSALRRVEMDV